ncbi:50S ribosomal protein L11 methyltransferase [Thermodesulfobacteriota bacterium]
MGKNSPDNTANHPGWLEISIYVDPSAREACSSFLFDMGCDGVVSEEFENNVIKAYLPEDTGFKEVKEKLELFLKELTDFFPEIQTPELTLTSIINQDWSTTWRSFFYLEQITDNLMILPAWEEMPEPVKSHVIRIDPGTAFGTGKHETTKMCLQALEENAPEKPWAMLDVGTGSGILSVYGAMLGAEKITAIDIDPEAVRWAKKNIELNKLPVEIDLSTTPLESVSGTYDVIAANIILNTILELSPLFPGLLSPGGLLILSGILREQAEKVEKKLQALGLIKTGTTYMGEWARITAKAG